LFAMVECSKCTGAHAVGLGDWSAVLDNRSVCN
jgi:hypothetical protein